MDSAEIVYLKSRAGAMQDLVSHLRKVGFRVSISESPTECAEKIAPDTAFLIVDGSYSDSDANKIIKTLLKDKIFYNTPTVFIGARAQQQVQKLEGSFTLPIPVDFPFSVKNMVPKLLAIHQKRKNAETQLQQTRTEKKPVQQPRQANTLLGNRKAETAFTRELSRIQTYRKKRSSKSSYGGEKLAMGTSLSCFEDAKLLPDHAKRKELEDYLRELTKKGEKHALHVRRVIFSASAISDMLRFGPHRNIIIRTCSLMLSSGFIDEQEFHDGAIDLFAPSSEEERSLIDAGLRKSAETCRTLLRDDVASRTIDVIRAQLLEEALSEPPQMIQDAQCVLISEIIDKAAWETGFWNPFSLYKTVRSFDEDNKFELGAEICEAAIRLASEAAIVRAQNGGYRIKVKSGTSEAEEAIRKAEEIFDKDKMKSLEVFELKEGMHLARPIVSMDGSVVLAANVRLDREVIQLILKLACIRPLHTPVAVVN